MKSSGTLLTSDNVLIEYDRYEQGHRHAVVIAHGFFNSKAAKLLQDLALALNDRYDVFVLDFRGHGKSQGLFYWTSREYLDLEQMLRFVRERHPRVGVVGFSLGAATSLIVAARTSFIDSLIAVSAPTEFERIEYRFWELDPDNDIFYNLVGEGRYGKGVRPGPFWLKKDKPISLVKQLKTPVLYVHGENDWLIKPIHSEELFKKTASRKALAMIKNGPHAEYLLRKHNTETLSAMRDWFNDTL